MSALFAISKQMYYLCNRFWETKHGWLPEWPNGADCKSAGSCLRWFESITTHRIIFFVTLYMFSHRSRCEAPTVFSFMGYHYFQAIKPTHVMKPKASVRFQKHSLAITFQKLKWHKTKVNKSKKACVHAHSLLIYVNNKEKGTIFFQKDLEGIDIMRTFANVNKRVTPQE